MDRTQLLTDDENYLHFTFKSRIFRFTDDVEFLFSGKDKIIHMRSASRTGYSDMGVNRKRIALIRSLFNDTDRKEKPGMNE